VLTTATSTSLLLGLNDSQNGEAWSRYVGRYRPLIVAFGRRLGLKVEDAEDAAQTTLFEFSEAFRAGRYDRDRGRLRAWLFGIAERQVQNVRRRVIRSAAVSAPEPYSGFLAEAADPVDPGAAWEEAWRQAVLRQALDEVSRQVEGRTFEAFRLFALDGMPAESVADRLGMTENAVFGAKRRVVGRLREVLPLMEDVF
jgi:RNA polymerase sigma-70 factor (ECF subfamily)